MEPGPSGGRLDVWTVSFGALFMHQDAVNASDRHVSRVLHRCFWAHVVKVSEGSRLALTGSQVSACQVEHSNLMLVFQNLGHLLEPPSVSIPSIPQHFHRVAPLHPLLPVPWLFPSESCRPRSDPPPSADPAGLSLLSNLICLRGFKSQTGIW